jgi:peroxiredoxin
MVSLETPTCNFSVSASNFSLLGVDNETWSLQDCVGENGLVVMFICNHCPYVKAILDRIVRDTLELKGLGVNTVAIMSNDTNEYEEDSFENMKRISDQFEFSFPYLIDQTQQIAKNYGAVCTPDFFGYNHDLELQYRGRLDESKKTSAKPHVDRELFNAMKLIAETRKGPEVQTPSIGCSIKWIN